jgi:hypothetical protein
MDIRRWRFFVIVFTYALLLSGRYIYGDIDRYDRLSLC